MCILEKGLFSFIFIVDGLVIFEKFIFYFLNCFEFIMLLLVFVVFMSYIGLVGMVLISFSEFFIIVC